MAGRQPPSQAGAELTPLSRRLLGAAVVVALALIALVSYAWLEGSEETHLNPIAKAAERTESTTGVRLAIGGYIAADGLPAITMSGEGEYDGRSGRYREDVTAELPGQGSFEVEGVGDGRMIYMRSERFDSELPEGKSWLGIEALGSAKTSGTGVGEARSQLKMLRAVASDFDDLGHVVIRGHPTTAYRTTIDLGRWADQMRDEGEGDRAEILEKFYFEEPEVTVWIDERGLLRRTRVVTKMEVPPTGRAMTTDLRVDYFEYGAVVEVDLPDPAEVFNVTETVKEQLGISTS